MTRRETPEQRAMNKALLKDLYERFYMKKNAILEEIERRRDNAKRGSAGVCGSDAGKAGPEQLKEVTSETEKVVQ